MKHSLTTFILFLFLINFFFLLNEQSYVLSKHCGYNSLRKKATHHPEFTHPIGEDARYLSTDAYEPIRIHLDYSFIERDLSKFNIKDLDALKNHIMPKTKSVFESLFRVKRLKSKLSFNNKYCDELLLPEEYLENGSGIDADIVIFVTIDDTGFFLENEIEAAAIHCLQHNETKRPVAGYIQFKPDLEMNDTTALDYLVWLAVHEVTHILVMNDGLYPHFINQNNQLLGVDNIIKETKHPISGNKITIIKSPKVVEKARQHFNCNELEGVPLEYNGGPGTAGAHWSKKIMNTDYMIGDSYGENLISDITLALFEDSGWYSVNYELSNLFLWGKSKGCDFFNKKCVSEYLSNRRLNDTNDNVTIKTINLNKLTSKRRIRHSKSTSSTIMNNKNINLSSNRVTIKRNQTNNKNSLQKSKEEIKINYKSSFPDEFCEKSNQPICSRHHIFRGNCAIKQFSSPLPDYESYFSNRSIGGVDTLTDKCPISIETKGNQYYYGGSCRKGEKKFDIEEICPECACFISSLKKQTPKRIKRLDIEGNEIKRNMRSFYKRDNRSKKANNSTYMSIGGTINSEINAMCFKFTCDSSNTLNVVFEGKNYKCGNDGVIIPGYSGKIDCPDSNLLCHNKFLCKFGCTEKYSNAIPYKILRKRS